MAKYENIYVQKINTEDAHGKSRLIQNEIWKQSSIHEVFMYLGTKKVYPLRTENYEGVTEIVNVEYLQLSECMLK